MASPDVPEQGGVMPTDADRDLWYVVWRALLMIAKALDKKFHFSGVTKSE